MQEPREDLSADRRGLWLLGNTAARREEAVRGKRGRVAVPVWWGLQRAERLPGVVAEW